MADQVKILDHGYCQLIETWGSDERIIESARMSTSGSFKGWGHECTCCAGTLVCEYPGGEYGPCSACKGKGEIVGDEKLLRYLYTHKHLTPFEMCGLTFEIFAPIMVFREWMRHRTLGFNEMSGRYTELPDVMYVPSIERIMHGQQSSKNKQGSEEGFSYDAAIELTLHFAYHNKSCRGEYEFLLKEGVAKELARLVLPVSQYSKMRVTGNLRNWLAFLTLRQDAAAQFEIRNYADAISSEIALAFPHTHALYVEGLPHDEV